MNVFDKLWLKLAWGRIKDKMPFLKTWGPVIGGAILIVGTVLQVLGYSEIAGGLLGIGAALGLNSESPVPAAEITAAFTQLVGGGLLAYGIVRKLIASAPQPAPKPKP